MALGRNDVDIETLKAVDQHIRETPGVGRLMFKAHSEWQRGTKTTVTLSQWTAGGHTMSPPSRRFTISVDEPPQLGGMDGAPNPVEVLLSAVAGCVTAGLATNGALFDVPLDKIEIDLEADVDARGVLGHDKKVRNGVTDLRYTVTIESSAPEDKVKRVKETIDRKSPVLDTLVNPVNMSSTLVYKPR